MASGTRAKAAKEKTMQILIAMQEQGQQQMEQLCQQFEELAVNQQQTKYPESSGNETKVRPTSCDTRGPSG